MSLLTFVHHLLNPHCPDCRAELREKREESKVCESCQTLIRQLEIANHEKEQLLERLLKEPDKQEVKVELPSQYIPPRQIPWAMRRQMLEEEDRKKAQLMRSAVKPDVKSSNVKDLERELGVDDAQDSKAEDKDAANQG